jgi:hypothetical protein
MNAKVNEAINESLMHCYKRAEKLTGQILEDTFVPIPQVDRILSLPEHHIIYGRRGTGKTHTLRRLERRVRANGGAAVYIDLRTIGSETATYGDQTIPLPSRATTLLVDVVNEIHEGIYELIIEDNRFRGNLDDLGPALDSLAEAATEVRIKGSTETEVTGRHTQETGRKSELKASLGLSSASLSGSASRTESDRSESTQRRLERGDERFHIVFGRLGSAFRKVAKALGDHGFWLFLDEWLAVPSELQPFLADMLRRNLFSVPGMTVKIGSIERRSRFLESQPSGNYIGIELGADTAAPLDIDEYLTFSQGISHAKAFFAELLFRHAGRSTTIYNGRTQFPSASDFVNMAFSDGAFTRLVEGSEGLPRDALQIAERCAALAVDKQITVSNVNNACTSYFLLSKEGLLSRRATGALAEIVERCLEAESRLIALRRPNQSRTEVIAELYDQRLIHKRGQGITLPDKPLGNRYDMFLVDLGCFTELINHGKLRLVDHGMRDRGIVSTKRNHRDGRQGPKPEYTLVPKADRWA